MDELVLSVTDFVGLLNQTLEFAYPVVVIEGEISNFRVSKNKWVYFDLKDEYSSVKFFGTVYQLPGPLEDGMLLRVRGNPRLHNLYGFSVTVQTMQPVGAGSIKKAAALLQAKLTAEGLFDPSRKRLLPFAPTKIGLITSGESAAYHDFIKILNERWQGVDVVLADVQVQGDLATGQIVRAIEYLNTHEDVEVIVITRGGGSADDLAAFSTEQVTRAVAGSRTPTVVAIGHEVDISLAELAADQRASTPTNAAQMIVPDRTSELAKLAVWRAGVADMIRQKYATSLRRNQDSIILLHDLISRFIDKSRHGLELRQQVLQAFNPSAALKRGYAIVRAGGAVVRSVNDVKSGQPIVIDLADGNIKAKVQ